MLAIGVLSLKPSGIDVQTDKRAESDWIKSLIFDNTKGTITLDSSALKLLMELSSSKYINIKDQISSEIKSLIVYFMSYNIYNMFGVM